MKHFTFHPHAITKTRHASVRQQQRCIPDFIISLLLDFGAVASAGNQTFAYHFDSDCWTEVLEQAPLPRAKMDKYRHAYLVADQDDTVITLAWRH